MAFMAVAPFVAVIRELVSVSYTLPEGVSAQNPMA